MMPLSKKTRKLTTQKATNSLAGVYQAGSVLHVSSIEDASGSAATDVLDCTPLVDAFSICLAEGSTARAIL